MQNSSKKFVVATIGDEYRATCSFKIASNYFDEETILCCQTFEEAIEMVKSKNVRFALVPSAYIKITDFYFDLDIERCAIYSDKLPDFYLASMNEVDWNEPHTLYSHPCPLRLKEIVANYAVFNEICTANSNTTAAIMARENTAICITNFYSAEALNLKKRKQLNEGPVMDFVLFRKKKAL